MKKSSKDIALGMTFEDDFEIADAIKHYSLALKDDPCNLDALRGKARCLILYIDEPVKLEEGLKITKELITSHGVEELSVYLLMAKFLWRLRQYQKALHWIDLTKSTFNENDHPELLFTEARILATNELKSWTKAENLTKKLHLNNANYIKARIRFAQNDFKNAQKYFETSFSKNFKITDDSAVDNFLICANMTRPENFRNGKNYEKNNFPFNNAISLGERFLKTNGKSMISWKIIRNIMTLMMTENRLLYNSNLTSKSSTKIYFENPKEKDHNKKQLSKHVISLQNKIISFVDWVQSNQNLLFQSDQNIKKNSVLNQLLMRKTISYIMNKEFDQAIVALDEYLSYSDIKKYEFHFYFYYYQLGNINYLQGNWKKAIAAHKKLKIHQKNNVVQRVTFIPLQIELVVLNQLIICYKQINDEKNVKLFQKIKDERHITSKQIKNESKVHSRQPMINGALARATEVPTKKRPILHPGKEGSRLEFKSSFFIHGSTVTRDGKTIKITNDKMRESLEIKGQEDIAATVCSFLNSEGGDLYIGVDDKTKICYGLEEEFKRTKNLSDVYTQTVRNNVQKTFREHYTNYLTFDFYDHHDPDTNEPMQLYQIHVEPLLNTEKQPCSVKHSEGKEVIYFREGDSDKRFDGIDGTVEWYKRIEINRNRIS
ncbi:MAG: putative DNA binding domain-containing protein [Nitrosopumilus sp.]|nr:putative DNA binding domain-containing protein [Nitrosopumilus sp.]